MIKKVYAICDKRSGLYSDLMTCRTQVEAQRNFERVCQNPNSMYNAYPNDFDLMHICDFSDEDGIIMLNNPAAPRFVVSASDYVKVDEAAKK